MEIFRYLAEKRNASVSDIVDHIGLTQPTVSYHLTDMKKSGLVGNSKRGKEVYYSINRMCPHAERVCVLKNINLEKDNYVQ